MPKLFNSLVNCVTKLGAITGDEMVDAEDTGDGGGGQAEMTEDIGNLVEIGIGRAGFNQAAGEDADEGDLIDKGLLVGGFDAGEIALIEAAGVEAVLDGIHVTGRGAAMGR